jgi:hypothetical protein
VFGTLRSQKTISHPSLNIGGNFARIFPLDVQMEVDGPQVDKTGSSESYMNMNFILFLQLTPI